MPACRAQAGLVLALAVPSLRCWSRYVLGLVDDPLSEDGQTLPPSYRSFYPVDSFPG